MIHPAQLRTATILRGSLITLRRKCGSRACHCLENKLHETPVLSYSLKGATKMLSLRPQDVPEVAAALKRYQHALQTLDRQALAGIHALMKLLQKERARSRKARQ